MGPGKGGAATTDYENVGPAVWKKSVRQASDAIFLRGTRTAVYSPTHESDTHNNSGYGCSKGPSPYLSGQLDVDARPPVASYAPPQKRAPVPLQRYNNQSCEDVVVAASLV